ncbi:hypothetical protein AURDEDRAFT_156290 [Auricularia subglabra TFB-10046 SS5]|nr:hypothetical protein AURDEDRAFT_156290 [Auricularia subglabra TFB-10046 SS5]
MPQSGYFLASLIPVPDIVLHQIEDDTYECNVAATLFLIWVARRISLEQSKLLSRSARGLADEQWAHHAETLLSAINPKALDEFLNLLLALTVDFLEAEVSLPSALAPHSAYAARVRASMYHVKMDRSTSFPVALRCTRCVPGTQNFKPRVCLAKNAALARAACDACHHRNRSIDCVVLPAQQPEADPPTPSRTRKRRARSSSVGTFPANKRHAPAPAEERQTLFDDAPSYLRQLAWTASETASLLTHSSTLFYNLANLYHDDPGEGEEVPEVHEDDDELLLKE